MHHINEMIQLGWIGWARKSPHSYRYRPLW